MSQVVGINDGYERESLLSQTQMGRKRGYFHHTSALLTVGLFVIICGSVLLVLGVTGVLSNPDADAEGDSGPDKFPGKVLKECVGVKYYEAKNNCMPGGQLTYPRSPGSLGGGIGTYEDPISFAGDTRIFPPGSLFYYPALRKYFIMELDCISCSLAYNTTKTIQVQLWIGPDFALSNPNLVGCMNGLSKVNQTIVVSPPPHLPTNTVSLYDINTNECIDSSFTCSDVDNELTCGSGFYCAIPESLSCSSIASTSNLTVSRFSELNPGLDCSMDVSQGTTVCTGGVCGN